MKHILVTAYLALACLTLFTLSTLSWCNRLAGQPDGNEWLMTWLFVAVTAASIVILSCSHKIQALRK